MLEEQTNFDGFLLIENELEDVSSTKIRDLLRKEDFKGLHDSAYVEDAVIEYLMRKGKNVYIP